jgi:hypothetical protein
MNQLGKAVSRQAAGRRPALRGLRVKKDATRTFHLMAFTVVLLFHNQGRCDTKSIRFESVDDFLQSVDVPAGMPHQADSIGVYGDLGGPQHHDWAGIVLVRDTTQCISCKRKQKLAEANPTAQLFVLMQEENGKYDLVAKSAQIEPDSAGTVKLARQSLFINGEHYNSLGGAAYRNQFKLYKGQWRLVGATFHYAKPYASDDGSGGRIYDDADASDIDRNVLTGTITIKSRPHGKRPNVRLIQVKPEVILLQEQSPDGSAGWLPEFGPYSY